MNEQYFEELKNIFTKYNKNYCEKIERQREIISRKEKTKGKKYNVFPYKEERLGNKLTGKEVSEIEMKDDNYIYHFDDVGRIRLVEEACTFLRKISDFECYDYKNDRIFYYSGNNKKFNYIQCALLENAKVMESYAISDLERFIYEKYEYIGERLYSIEKTILCENKEPRKWIEYFYYNGSVLKMIQKVEGSHKINNYCTESIKYKKLDKLLEQQCIDIFQQQENYINTNKNYFLEINLQDINHFPDLDITFKCNEKNVYENKYPYVNKIQLRKYPLDEEEEKKIIGSILKSILRLWEDKIIPPDIFVKLMIESKNISNNQNVLPRWIMKQSEVIINDNKFMYNNILKNQEKKEGMMLIDIFEEMKKMNKNMSFDELLTHFNNLANIEIKDKSYEEELFFMQSEVIKYKDDLKFGILLVRQIPSDDEYIQLGINVIYELNDKNKRIGSTIWSDGIEGDFFDYIRKTEVYKLIEDEKIVDVKIYMEET